LSKEETCSMWTNSIVPARRIGITLFFIVGECILLWNRCKPKHVTCLIKSTLWHSCERIVVFYSFILQCYLFCTIRNLPNEETKKQYLNLLKITCIKQKVFLKIPKVMRTCANGSRMQDRKKIHISSPMVQSEALAVAKSIGTDQFKVSTGWLDSFMKMHDIVWNGVCGESKDVDESVASINQNCLNWFHHMNLKTFIMRTKQDCFYGYYQLNHSRLRGKNV
jgi:hypothetical protein